VEGQAAAAAAAAAAGCLIQFTSMQLTVSSAVLHKICRLYALLAHATGGPHCLQMHDAG
jgi:hypothetical protein